MDTLVADIFQQHYNYYGEVGAETIKQQAGQVEQVVIDYQGRVIFELLQNAFDKAKDKIKVMVRNGQLYVANDGEPFTYRKNYNYKDGTNERGDFQALCSISTSRKDVNTSIGNKGVGFKSVFSVSANGYANIHTRGVVIGDKGKSTDKLISFRIYEAFTDVRNIPKQLPAAEKFKLRDHIKKSRYFNKDKGVPGYYYPVWLEDQDKQVKKLLAEGYVTIVQVPLPPDDLEVMEGFFQEIKKVNFHFIQLRVNSPFITSFEFEGVPSLNFVKRMSPTGNPYYLHCGVNERVKALAKAAGIPIHSPQVALSFKQAVDDENGRGKLYNYLPTEVPSPFKLIDLHADFHTTVDRTGINFKSTIGAYNRAMLEAAIELVYYVFNQYLEPKDRLNFNFRYLDIAQVRRAPGFEFFWKFTYAKAEPPEAFDMVRRLFDISHYQYQTAADFFARLADCYFRSVTRQEVAQTSFFTHLALFAEEFTRYSGLSRDYPLKFKEQLVAALKMRDVPLIPSGKERPYTVNEEVIYQPEWQISDDCRIPDFIGLNITSYKIPDDQFRRLLDIKDVIVSNEVLKYYRQVSPAGEVHGRKEAYSEQTQKQLLRSIALLIDKPKEKIASTHRYLGYLSVYRPNTPADLANFSVSTVFLKIKTTDRSKLYKPAQLCLIEEVDLKFLPALPPNVSQRFFLKYLGVSYACRYRFVDKPIWDKLSDGLDYIPPIYRRAGEKNAALAYARVVKQVRVIQRSKDIHPALINDNQYSFLEDIRTHEYQDEFTPLLVKNYPSFPEAYLANLLTVCEKQTATRKTELIKFYQFIFDPLARLLKTCLISCGGEIAFVKTNTLVYTVHQERDFRLAQKSGLPVLCFYGRRIDSTIYGLNGRTLNLKEEQLRAAGKEEVTGFFRELIEKKIFYLLTEITERRLTDSPYFENPERIKLLSQELGKLRFYQADSLQRELSSEYFDGPILDDRDYDIDGDNLYLRKDLTPGVRAEGIARALFNNQQFAQTIELVLFRRNEQELEQQGQKYTGVELDLFQKYWIPEFQKKFIQFTKKIIKLFGAPYPAGDPHWYRYNKTHQSIFIEQAAQNHLLGELKEVVDRVRMHFEKGMFAYFQLDIDEEMYDEQIARLQLILSKESGDAAQSFQRHLKTLIGKLGIAQKLAALENEIRAAFPAAFGLVIPGATLKAQTAQVALDSNIEKIFQSLQNIKSKQQHQMAPLAGQHNQILPVKTKKVIFQGECLPGSSERSEDTGAGGEVDVLNLMIAHFLELDLSKRKHALKAVHELILSKLKNDKATVIKHTSFYNECQHHLSTDVALTKAMIPFYYVTLHYKYAFADLFAWYQGRAVIVEVKSTSSTGKHDFSISGGEVNEARQTENYLLIRVTPEEIIFMGNPVYEVRSQFTLVKGSSFQMEPTGFNFKYKHY